MACRLPPPQKFRGAGGAGRRRPAAPPHGMARSCATPLRGWPAPSSPPFPPSRPGEEARRPLPPHRPAENAGPRFPFRPPEDSRAPGRRRDAQGPSRSPAGDAGQGPGRSGPAGPRPPRPAGRPGDQRAHGRPCASAGQTLSRGPRPEAHLSRAAPGPPGAVRAPSRRPARGPHSPRGRREVCQTRAARGADSRWPRGPTPPEEQARGRRGGRAPGRAALVPTRISHRRPPGRGVPAGRGAGAGDPTPRRPRPPPAPRRGLPTMPSEPQPALPPSGRPRGGGGGTEADRPPPRPPPPRERSRRTEGSPGERAARTHPDAAFARRPRRSPAPVRRPRRPPSPAPHGVTGKRRRLIVRGRAGASRRGRGPGRAGRCAPGPLRVRARPRRPPLAPRPAGAPSRRRSARAAAAAAAAPGVTPARPPPVPALRWRGRGGAGAGAAGSPRGCARRRRRRRRRGCPAPRALGASCRRRRRGASPVPSERGIFQLVISAASTPGPGRQPGGVLAPPARAAPRAPRPRRRAAPGPARAEFAKSQNCGRRARRLPAPRRALGGHCLPWGRAPASSPF
ncbi:basic proline-rich protein-like [Hippopotamus amphibius kiboko]|uniref:basic proline-rich protein-like n=1 Tax=Hippopotamus amphibius kiboko TaxID=575201 RepID=UPI0025980F99|nr:basic proline-rich protein-like [Hippopotamus amphibius kiboko]